MTDGSSLVQWLTVTEACKHLRVSKATLYAYMKDERLPFYYLAGTHQRRVKMDDLNALLARGKPEDLDIMDESDE